MKLQSETVVFNNYVIKATKPREEDSPEGGVDLLPKVEVPKKYAVILLNDDYTPMEFVTLVLKRFFGHNEQQAATIMLQVHQKGSGVAGVYTLEIAEMKTLQVQQYSQTHQYPLKCIMEEA